MATEIKNLSTGTTKAVTMQMPAKTLLFEVDRGVDSDGAVFVKYQLQAADAHYPASLTIRIRHSAPRNETTASWRYETRGVETDAAGDVIVDQPVVLTQTLVVPGVSGLFDVADVLVFLQNAWGALFTDVSAGAINSVVMDYIANNIPTI